MRKYYKDYCPTCGKEKSVRKDKIGKNCLSCSSKKKQLQKYGERKNCIWKNCLQLTSGEGNYCKDHKKRIRDDYNKKNNARHAFHNFYSKGLVKKEPCLCGELDVQAHHQNYDNPLYIIWLCNNHHRLIHKGELLT